MKLIVVTPAGCERYLRLLSHYVLGADTVDEWHLWDNCRNQSDRAYLHQLASSDRRCQVKKLPGADGGFAIIGDFFQFCDDPDAFYVRMDDDIVFTEPDFFGKFIERARRERGRALWFAPLIINNAICASLIKHLSRVIVEGPVSCQAMCPWAWAHAGLPEALHPVLIEAAKRGRLADFHVPDREIRLSRFSINTIGFFGDEKLALGDSFCPLGQGNEEEWISAVLPAKLGRCGMVLGDTLVAHFSFYTQERRLLQTDLLEQYYALAGLRAPDREWPVDVKPWKDRLRPWKKRPAPERPQYSVRLRELTS